MIHVLPQTQAGKDGVVFGYISVIISAVFPFVVFGKRKKTVALRAGRRCGLRRDIAEQLGGVVDCIVAVAVKSKPGVVRTRRCPGTERRDRENQIARRVRHRLN